MNFSYVTHEVRVVFGAGSLSGLPSELDRCGLAKVMLLTTPGRATVRDALLSLLGDRMAGGYTGARLHVPVEVVRDARAALDRMQPESLLAFGGGSAIGLGKALAHVMRATTPAAIGSSTTGR